MKCQARLSDNAERKETCQNNACYKLTFHTGVKTCVCNEHNEEGKKIEYLIIGRQVI